MEVIAFTVSSKQVQCKFSYSSFSTSTENKKMSDNEDNEASDEGEDIIQEFDRLNFNEDDNDSNFTWYYDQPNSRKRGPSDIIKVTAGLTDSSKGIET